MSLKFAVSELTEKSAEMLLEFIALFLFLFFYSDACVIWHSERKQSGSFHYFIMNSHSQECQWFEFWTANSMDLSSSDAFTLGLGGPV